MNFETISAAQVGAALTPLVRQPAVCRLTSDLGRRNFVEARMTHKEPWKDQKA